MRSVIEIQKRLAELGYDLGKTGADGRLGKSTNAAIVKFQKEHGLEADGIAGHRTQASLWPLGDAPETGAPTHPDLGMSPKFDSTSAKNLAEAHPLIQQLMNAARERIAFQVLDARRGEAAQKKAKASGASKVGYGDSAHNYSPSIAVDITPLPVNGKIPWDNEQAFKDLWLVIGWYDPKSGKGAGLALELQIPIRWGGDWDMDGSHEKGKGWDMPHYELHPWRFYAKQVELYKGK